MPFYFFQWTDEIEAHLAEHDVDREEFEEVLTSPDRVEPSRTSDRQVAIGETSQGRLLVCVYEHFDETTIIPVTAFERR